MFTLTKQRIEPTSKDTCPDQEKFATLFMQGGDHVQLSKVTTTSRRRSCCSAQQRPEIIPKEEAEEVEGDGEGEADTHEETTKILILSFILLMIGF